MTDSEGFDLSTQDENKIRRNLLILAIPLITLNKDHISIPSSINLPGGIKLNAITSSHILTVAAAILLYFAIRYFLAIKERMEIDYINSLNIHSSLIPAKIGWLRIERDEFHEILHKNIVRSCPNDAKIRSKIKETLFADNLESNVINIHPIAGSVTPQGKRIFLITNSTLRCLAQPNPTSNITLHSLSLDSFHLEKNIYQYAVILLTSAAEYLFTTRVLTNYAPLAFAAVALAKQLSLR